MKAINTTTKTFTLKIFILIIISGISLNGFSQKKDYYDHIRIKGDTCTKEGTVTLIFKTQARNDSFRTITTPYTQKKNNIYIKANASETTFSIPISKGETPKIVGERIITTVLTKANVLQHFPKEISASEYKVIFFNTINKMKIVVEVEGVEGLEFSTMKRESKGASIGGISGNLDVAFSDFRDNRTQGSSSKNSFNHDAKTVIFANTKIEVVYHIVFEGSGGWIGLFGAATPNLPRSFIPNHPQIPAIELGNKKEGKLLFPAPTAAGNYELRFFDKKSLSYPIAKLPIKVVESKKTSNPPTTKKKEDCFPASHAIISEFQSGTEGWKITGNGMARSQVPKHVKGNNLGQSSSIIRSNTHRVEPHYISSGEKKSLPEGGAMDIVLAFDVSRSMDTYFRQVVEETQTIVQQLKSEIGDVRLALISFSDVKIAGGLVSYPFSHNVSAQLQIMDSWQADGGNPVGESQFEAIEAALKGLKWRNSGKNNKPVARVILVVSDEEAEESGKYNAEYIIQEARKQQQSRIYPILIEGEHGSFPKMLEQASAMAKGTRGKYFRVNESATVAAALMESLETAAEETAPRYWQAPAKFLGDQSEAYSGQFSFFLRQQDIDREFNAYDVILQGLHYAIGIRAFDPPDRNWQHYTFRLDETELWEIVESGEKASRKAFKEVLSNLRGIKIRADFKMGKDKVDLDQVMLQYNSVAGGTTILAKLKKIRRKIKIKEQALNQLVQAHDSIEKECNTAKTQVDKANINLAVNQLTQLYEGTHGNQGPKQRLILDYLQEIDESVCFLLQENNKQKREEWLHTMEGNHHSWLLHISELEQLLMLMRNIIAEKLINRAMLNEFLPGNPARKSIELLTAQIISMEKTIKDQIETVGQDWTFPKL